MFKFIHILDQFVDIKMVHNSENNSLHTSYFGIRCKYILLLLSPCCLFFCISVVEAPRFSALGYPIRIRIRIRIKFRIRVRNPCTTGSSSITYNVLFAVRKVLTRLNNRWNAGTGRLLIGNRNLACKY